MDIVSALRQLFDTFKPGGEGQACYSFNVFREALLGGDHSDLGAFRGVLFSAAWWINLRSRSCVGAPRQWHVEPKAVEPVTAYSSADTVFQAA